MSIGCLSGRDSSVSVVTMQRAARSGVRIPTREIDLYLKCVKTVSGAHPAPPMPWIPGALSSGVWRPEREPHHLRLMEMLMSGTVSRRPTCAFVDNHRCFS